MRRSTVLCLAGELGACPCCCFGMVEHMGSVAWRRPIVDIIPSCAGRKLTRGPPFLLLRSHQGVVLRALWAIGEFLGWEPIRAVGYSTHVY